MTNRQKQCLLACLGCYTGSIDGIWGPQSQAATRAFQQQHGITPNGIWDKTTQAKLCQTIGSLADSAPEDWWQEIRFFLREEFACKCGSCGGFPAEPRELLIRTADRLRQHFDAPVTVSSGIRCPQHNARIGGVSNSRHLDGKAMDFSVAGQKAGAVLDYVHQQPQIRYAYAIDDRWVHMDIA